MGGMNEQNFVSKHNQNRPFLCMFWRIAVVCDWLKKQWKYTIECDFTHPDVTDNFRWLLWFMSLFSSISSNIYWCILWQLCEVENQHTIPYFCRLLQFSVWNIEKEPLIFSSLQHNIWCNMQLLHRCLVPSNSLPEHVWFYFFTVIDSTAIKT
jgi:hypothetical protein